MVADVTAVVAIYAAVVATGGLVWQVYSWSREHATRIKVEATWGFLASGPNTSDSMAFVTVYNRSGHSVEIRGVGWVLDSERSTSMPIIATPPGATLPGTVGPRSQGQTWLPAAGLTATLRGAGKPKGTMLRAYATDGEGRRHLSEPFPSW